MKTFVKFSGVCMNQYVLLEAILDSTRLRTPCNTFEALGKKDRNLVPELGQADYFSNAQAYSLECKLGD